MRGLSHVRSGRKNEDAFDYLACDDASKVVLAVADGHGSDLAFRCDVGSRIAVATAAPLLMQFAEVFGTGNGTSPVTDSARHELAETLTSTWHFAVQRHLNTKPFSQAELEELAAVEGPRAQRALERNPALAYGSTFLGVIATQTYVLSVRLGDGDILLVDAKGVGRRAIPLEQPTQPTPVPSLAQQAAASKLRIHVQDASGGLPAMVLAATDGYTESFPTDHDFLHVGSRYLQTARTQGFRNIDRWLGGFLEEAQTAGSQDDITVGLIALLGV